MAVWQEWTPASARRGRDDRGGEWLEEGQHAGALPRARRCCHGARQQASQDGGRATGARSHRDLRVRTERHPTNRDDGGGTESLAFSESPRLICRNQFFTRNPILAVFIYCIYTYVITST